MGSLRMRRGRRTSRDDGASLVEFALVSPLLFMLLFGTLTGGLTLTRQNSVENAVRETGRFGAVLPVFDGATNLAEMYAQVEAAATGDLDDGTPGRVICVALIEDDNTWDYALYGTSDTPTTGDDQPLASVPTDCRAGFDSTVGTGTRRVWVRAARDSDIQAIIYNQTVTLESRALTRYER